MDTKPLTTFNLPESQKVDVYLVRLPDGRMVARTREEIERATPAPSSATATDPRRI